jgi:hypothetical protein
MALEVTAHMLLQYLLKFRQSIDTDNSDFHFWVMTSPCCSRLTYQYFREFKRALPEDEGASQIMC